MKTILVIDDNPLNNLAYIEPVESICEVKVTMSFATAYRRIMMYHYDLVVIDIMMPTQNLATHDELSAGLHFYTEKLQGENITSKILFWSNLSQETFNNYFQGSIPPNVYFQHKELDNENHLLAKVKELIGTL